MHDSSLDIQLFSQLLVELIWLTIDSVAGHSDPSHFQGIPISTEVLPPPWRWWCGGRNAWSLQEGGG